MSCQDVRGHLVELLYDELPAERRGPIEAHLEKCPQCRSEWEALREGRASLDVLGSEVDVPAIDTRRLFHAAARRAQRQRRRWKRAAVVASAACAVLLVLVLVLSALRVEVQNGRAVITWGATGAGVPVGDGRNGDDERRDDRRDAASDQVDSLAARIAAQERDLSELASRMQTIGELAQLATRELLSVDQRHSEELARLRSVVNRLERSTTASVQELREQSELRWRLTVHELGRLPGLAETSVESPVPGE